MSAPPGDPAGRFADRAQAGEALAARLLAAPPEDAVVAALPRGGVPVAAPVARALRAPLDVVVVRKLGLPWQPELALGAVGEGGVRVLNPDVAADVPPRTVRELTDRATAQVVQQAARWRGDASAADVTGRTVVLVDDGIATGASVRAAVAVLRARSVARVVLAVPVVVHAVAEQLRPLVEDLVALREPARLGVVSAWYDDFAQVSEQDVRSALAAARTRL